jgi:hypothetical protein
MKNKKLINLIALLLVAIAIFVYDKVGDKLLPIKLNADKIEEITISTDRWGEDAKKDIILIKENNTDEIMEIARLFNESVKHENQKMGTTHLTCVGIKYNSEKEISFHCGVGAIFTVYSGKRQYNYINGELDEYIAELISLSDLDSILITGEYVFDDLVYVGSISSSTYDYTKEKKEGAEYIIEKDALTITSEDGGAELSNIYYEKEKLTDELIDESYFVEDTNLMEFFGSYEERYRYSIYDEAGEKLGYYIFLLDDDIFICHFAKADSLIFSIDKIIPVGNDE